MSIPINDILTHRRNIVLSREEFESLPNKNPDAYYLVFDGHPTVVELDPNGGIISGKSSISCNSCSLLTEEAFPNVQSTDYDFIGWFTSRYFGDRFLFKKTQVGDITKLYARWKWKLGNRIIFLSDEKRFSNDSSEKIAYLQDGERVGTNIPEDFVTDDDFDGFYIGDVKVEPSYVPDTDVCAIARFIK